MFGQETHVFDSPIYQAHSLVEKDRRRRRWRRRGGHPESGQLGSTRDLSISFSAGPWLVGSKGDAAAGSIGTGKQGKVLEQWYSPEELPFRSVLTTALFPSNVRVCSLYEKGISSYQ